MRTHFHAEIGDLEQAVVALAKNVSANIFTAVQSLQEQNRDKAVAAMRADHAIDLLEVRNEEACLKIIALHQPVADDLRYLIVLDKVNHDLERISDLAVKIAQSILLAPRTVKHKEYCDEMAGITTDVGERLDRVLRALLQKDEQTSRKIWQADAEVNARCRNLGQSIRTTIVARPEQSEGLFAMLAAIGHIERMADHVKNIAKNIIYLACGNIVRHRAGDYIPLAADRKVRVLFVCVHNSARSQMAEAWLNRLHGERFEAYSAGLEPGAINPLVVAAMQEVGMDLSGNHSTDVYDCLRRGETYDYLIAVCDETQADRCPPALGIREEIHWSFPDPAKLQGSDEERLAAIRKIRDNIRDSVDQWAGGIDAVKVKC